MSLVTAIICLQLGLVALSLITKSAHGGYVIAQVVCCTAVVYLSFGV